MFADSTLQRIEVRGITLAVRLGGERNRTPLLLLHGHPQTHAMWHRVWDALGAHFTLVAPDLRGYGDSDKPPSNATLGHAPYSKRTMAEDAVALMAALGHPHFRLLAHDRGARVGHRLMIDHPHAVERATLLDIAPTLAMYEQTTMDFARAYWHWFFLIQPEPLPETMIGADTDHYLDGLMGRRHAGLAAFDERALAEYRRCLRLPGAVHAMCEDYRAAASIDLEHDRADRAAARRITQPLQVLWGAHGVVARCFAPLSEWQRVADDVRGGALPCGHYLAEEAPDALLAAALPFLLADTPSSITTTTTP